jgi:hypothetical protein
LYNLIKVKDNICSSLFYRFLIDCEGNGKIDAKCLPPCLDSLLTHHIHRSNYQTAVWRCCDENDPETPSPVRLGWERSENRDLVIRWVLLRPAPEEILELFSCYCSRSCKQGNCPCLTNQLKCTAACHWFVCENRIVLDYSFEETYSDDDDDDDYDEYSYFH